MTLNGGPLSCSIFATVGLAFLGLGPLARPVAAQTYLFNRADFATGDSPATVVTGDFNGDGIPDLAVTNFQDGTVSILLGQSNGFFGPKTDFPAGSYPSVAVAGDFNHDGKLDLATTGCCQSSGVVSVLLGRGDGSFETPVEYSVGSEPDSIAAGDFNSDGNLDLAVANANCPFGSCGQGTISVLIGNGDGTFAAQQTFDTATEPGGIITGDFNGDGRLDLAAAAANCPGGACGPGSMSVLLGNGDGTFQLHVDYPVGSSPEFEAAADFNGDGKLDLAVVNAVSLTISILLGNGDGTFQPQEAIPSNDAAGAIETADVNGDGKPDLMIVDNPASGVAVFLGNGDGTFRPQLVYSAGSYPASIAIADLNGDGKVDLAVSNEYSNSLTVLLGNGNGTFSPQVSLPQGPSNPITGQLYALATVIGDFNGDGVPDLGIAEGNQDYPGAGDISVLLGKGGGAFQPFINTASGASGAIAAADFNGDRKLDVAFADGNGAAVALGNGDGTFGTPLQVVGSNGGTPSWAVVTGDFNNDGNQDLVVLQNGFLQANPIFVLLGNGNGTFQAAKQFGGATLVAEAIASGDFNRDGKLDLVVAVNPNGISVFLGNGDGTFQNPVTYATDSLPDGLTVADVNGDGIPDVIAVAQKADVFLGKGDGTFSAAIDYNAGFFPFAVAAADFNADGKTDLATASLGFVNTVALLLGNGDGTFQQPLEISNNGSSYPLMAGDLNQDGTADIVTSGGFGSIFFSAPIVTLSPTSLNFGAVSVGSVSPQQNVNLTNSGNAPLILNSVIATGDYTVSNSCGNPVAIAAQCSISVAFAPTTGGTLTGTLTITDNAVTSPQSVTLTGIGGEVSLDPTSLSFPEQTVGTTSAPQPVTLTNHGTAALAITSITAGANFAETNNCGTSLLGGATCTIDVTFKPLFDGPLTGTLTVTDSDPGSPQTVSLTGTGVALLADAPTLSVDFDGDGKADLAVWRADTSSWYVLPSDGGKPITTLQGLPGDVPVVGDYDGDGKSDYGLWRPSNGTFYVILSSNGTTVTEAWGLAGDVPVEADYDGDGKTDYAVWRPSNATWYIKPSNGGATITFAFGLPGDVPVVGDYNGDGKADYAVWRPSTGTWYVSPSGGGATVTQTWGSPGDIPAEGDYDGDGKTDYAVWRPSNGTWYIMPSGGGANITKQWGLTGDIPVVGDYDGDLKNDYAVWRPSNGTWYILQSSNGKTVTTGWGLSGDLPATHLPVMERRDKHIANFDGDRKTDIGIWRPSNGTWYVIDSTTGKSVTQAWGENGDLIVPGDYDGDGKTDYAVWRPSTATFYVVPSSAPTTSLKQQLGQSTDIPVPGDYDGDGKTDYAVWQPSNGTYTVILSSTGKTVTQQWGESGDIPTPADYDGDGKTDYAIWRPSTGTYYVLLSSTGKTVAQPWGENGDLPVPGDYDGDTKADFTIFRASTGTWYTLQSSNGKTITTVFGEKGDIPVAKDYDGDEKADIAVFRPSKGTWYILQSSNGKTTTTQWGTSTDVPVNKPTGQ